MESPAKTYKEHFRATIKLGVPLIGSQLAIMLMGVTDTVMVGWYGIPELAGTVLATQFFFVMMIFGAGFSQAVMLMAAQAEGADDPVQVRRVVRMGLWIAILFSAIAIVPLLQTERIYLMLGQEPVVAAFARDYITVGMWALFPTLIAHVFRSFLAAVEHAKVIFIVTTVGLVVNAVLNYAFIFGNWGAPEMGVQGSALATLLVNFLILLIITFYVLRNTYTAKFNLLVRFWRPDWAAFWEVIRIGFPIAVSILAEVGMFIFSSIFIGWLGVLQLAAHGIALQIASVAFMVPLGLSNVAAVRVGKAWGRTDPIGLDRAAITVMTITIAFSLLSAVIMVLFPETMVRWFLDDAKPEIEQVILFAVPMLLVGAAFQLGDAAQAVAMGLTRGIKDTKVPMIMAVVSYWLIGLPLAYWLGIRAQYGGAGVWTGLAIGLAVAAVLINGRFYKLRSELGQKA